ncbi:hypothetical protein B0H13DRAFT_1878517 [Mycena leptocephala]|nr:hypothetical protein B0H13DRAFT_1878517 [Mycena leptocephala]
MFDNGGMGECGAQPDENSNGGAGEAHAGVVLSDGLLHRGTQDGSGREIFARSRTRKLAQMPARGGNVADFSSWLLPGLHLYWVLPLAPRSIDTYSKLSIPYRQHDDVPILIFHRRPLRPGIRAKSEPHSARSEHGSSLGIYSSCTFELYSAHSSPSLVQHTSGSPVRLAPEAPPSCVIQ